ncbi:MAG: hypothetical protein COB37_04135 [Kordiimonadales bacterium]|nr:MAG: hypothetical protein COB37_04135 [Kordiimonadales bacterium]
MVTGLAVITAMASGAAVLQLKLAVQDKTDNVRKIVQDIQVDERAIRLLEAELAYQTSPNRLQEQSNRFLALMAPKASQVLADPSSIPERPAGARVDSSIDLTVALEPEVKKPTKKRLYKRKGAQL